MIAYTLDSAPRDGTPIILWLDIKTPTLARWVGTEDQLYPWEIVDTNPEFIINYLKDNVYGMSWSPLPENSGVRSSTKPDFPEETISEWRAILQKIKVNPETDLELAYHEEIKYMSNPEEWYADLIPISYYSFVSFEKGFNKGKSL